mmetsp:Transcript_80774/g.212061  ORF Transcript_80774/g.212061 Transcript_80774/m.212061 type:complete len:170 (+) Transcript_80774:112-621(+)
MTCRLTSLFSQYLQQTRAQNSFSTSISKRLLLLTTSDCLKNGKWEFPLHQSDCHAFSMPAAGQQVHGGVIATMVEDCTTMHICANDARGRKAVTTDLSLSHLGVGKVGRVLKIDTNILKIGNVLGVADATISDRSSGKVIAVARHTMMFIGEDNSAMEFAQTMASTFDV